MGAKFCIFNYMFNGWFVFLSLAFFQCLPPVCSPWLTLYSSSPFLQPLTYVTRLSPQPTSSLLMVNYCCPLVGLIQRMQRAVWRWCFFWVSLHINGETRLIIQACCLVCFLNIKFIICSQLLFMYPWFCYCLWGWCSSKIFHHVQSLGLDFGFVHFAIGIASIQKTTKVSFKNKSKTPGCRSGKESAEGMSTIIMDLEQGSATFRCFPGPAHLNQIDKLTSQYAVKFSRVLQMVWLFDWGVSRQLNFFLSI